MNDNSLLGQVIYIKQLMIRAANNGSANYSQLNGLATGLIRAGRPIRQSNQIAYVLEKMGLIAPDSNGFIWIPDRDTNQINH